MPLERPPFSALNFRSGSYHFHKWHNIPLWSITILHFLPSGDHHFHNLFMFKPFFATRGQLTAVGQRLGLAAGQRRPTVSSGDPHIHARAGTGALHFHARAQSGAPHFSLCRGTYLPKFGASPPPPPPPPRTLLRPTTHSLVQGSLIWNHHYAMSSKLTVVPKHISSNF